MSTRSPPPSGFRHRNLPLLLLQARECVMASFRPVLNAHGVTEQQWRIVRALLEHGPLEPRQIGRHCRISSPSLAGVLARMDDLGLVTRERLPHDQRRVQVQLTAGAQALAATMAPRIEAVYAQLEARVGPQRIDELYTRLDALVALLEDPTDGPGAPAEAGGPPADGEAIEPPADPSSRPPGG